MACRMLLALPHVFLRQKSSVNQSRVITAKATFFACLTHMNRIDANERSFIMT